MFRYLHANHKGLQQAFNHRGSCSAPLNLLNHGRAPLAIPSRAQMRISASLCTLSFQRYCSSRPTPNSPTMGLFPNTARNSLAVLPFLQGGITPCRACRSATSIGTCCAKFFCFERTHRATAVIRNHTGIRIDLARFTIPKLPQVHTTVSAARQCRLCVPALADRQSVATQILMHP